MVKTIKNTDFNKNSLCNTSQFTLNSEPTGDTQAVTKRYVDSVSKNDRNRQDLSKTYNDRDNQFDKFKLVDLDSITVNRSATSSNEVSNEKYFDDEKNKNANLKFIQSLQNCLKIAVVNTE